MCSLPIRMGLIDMIAKMKGDSVTLADLSQTAAHDEKLIGMFAKQLIKGQRLRFGLWQLKLLMPMISPYFEATHSYWSER